MPRKIGAKQELGIRLLKLIQNKLESNKGRSYKDWTRVLFPGIDNQPGEMFQIRIQQLKNACSDIRYNIRSELKQGKTPPVILYTIPVKSKFDRRLFNARNMPYLSAVLESLNETITGLIYAREQLERMTDAKRVLDVKLTAEELYRYTKPRQK